MKYLYPVLLLFLLPVKETDAQNSSLGTRFWLAYMENLDLAFNSPPEFSITIHAPMEVEGTISVPQTGLEIPFVIGEAGFEEVFLPSATWYSEDSEEIDNKGILIESSVPVQVTATHYRNYFCDATRVLPESELGGEYLVLAAEDFNQSHASQFVIVATDDNTEVEITPSTLTSGLHPAGVPFTVELDAGQIYQVQASGDLSGTHIWIENSDKIAVFAGALQADILCNPDDSHLWDQILPRNQLGTDYPLVPFSEQGDNLFKVVATLDGTELLLDGENIASLSEGEVFDITLSSASLLSSDKPIMVGQFNGSSACNPDGSGPTFVALDPISKMGLNGSFHSSAEDYDGVIYFQSHYVTIVSETGSTELLFLDGNGIDFEAFDSDPNLSYARVQVGSGPHRIESDAGFWAQSYGFNVAEAYSYMLNYEVLPNALAVSISSEDGDLCIGEVLSFSYQPENSLEDPIWEFGDGFQSGEQEPVHIYEEEGTYTVVLTGINEFGSTVSDTQVIFVQDCGVGILEEGERNSLWLDASGNIILNLQMEANLLLRNALGQILISESIQAGNQIVHIPGLSRGVYFATLTTTTGTYTTKLYAP